MSEYTYNYETEAAQSKKTFYQRLAFIRDIVGDIVYHELSIYAASWAAAEFRFGDSRVPHWRRTADEKPKSGVPVIALIVNRLGNTRRIRAEYAMARTLEVDEDNVVEGFGEYDEASDSYWCPEGWYETNEYEETHWQVSDPVTHWMPLPELPSEVRQ